MTSSGAAPSTRVNRLVAGDPEQPGAEVAIRTVPTDRGESPLEGDRNKIGRGVVITGPGSCEAKQTKPMAQIQHLECPTIRGGNQRERLIRLDVNWPVCRCCKHRR